MSTLKGLTFTTLPATNANPVIDRRNRVVARLEEQKALAADPKFTRTVRRRVKKDGQSVLEEKSQKIQPSWRAAPTGGYAFFIRLGQFVEFSKGQKAVAVPSLEKLPETIDKLIAAVKAGELDNQIAAASVRPTKKVVKK